MTSLDTFCNKLILHSLVAISDRPFALYIVMFVSSLGQGRSHRSRVLLLQLVLYFGISSLHKSALKFYLALLQIQILIQILSGSSSSTAGLHKSFLIPGTYCPWGTTD